MKKLISLTACILLAVTVLAAKTDNYVGLDQFEGSPEETMAFWTLTGVQLVGQGRSGGYIVLDGNSSVTSFLANGTDPALLATPPKSSIAAGFVVPAIVAAEMARICGDRHGSDLLSTLPFDCPLTFFVVVPISPDEQIVLEDPVRYVIGERLDASIAGHGLREGDFYSAWEAEGLTRDALIDRIIAEDKMSGFEDVVIEDMRLMKAGKPENTPLLDDHKILVMSYIAMGAVGVLVLTGLAAFLISKSNRRQRNDSDDENEIQA